MDKKCFELGGIKMLYSSSFLTEPEFDALYNGEAYRALKWKYDAAGNAQTLYRKVAIAPVTMTGPRRQPRSQPDLDPEIARTGLRRGSGRRRSPARRRAEPLST